MDHPTAVKVTTEYKPEFKIDPQNAKLPHCIVVRRKAGGLPYSIQLPPDLIDDKGNPAPDKESDLLKAALDSAERSIPE